MACYTGPAGTQGVGVCVGGLETCNAQGTAYGACTGEVLPSLENCATAADEDCDGLTPACAGGFLWSKGYGGPNNQEGLTLAVDASGNVIVGGYSDEAINFGCGVEGAGNGEAPTLFKLDPAGNCLWSKVFDVPTPGTSDDTLGIALSPTGDIFITVTFYGSVNLGGGVLTSVGSADIAVAKYDTNGNYQWAHQYGDANLQAAYALAADSAGNVIVAGGFEGSLNFGGGALTNTSGVSVFVAKLSSTGAFVWAEKFGTSGTEFAYAVAADPSGNLLFTGANVGTVNFGCGALVTAGGSDAFIAKLSPAGACLWSKGYGDASNQGGRNITTDAAGNVIATGYFDGTTNFGGGAVTSTGGDDTWLVKLDPSGNYLWSKVAGGAGNDAGNTVAVDAFGNVAWAGAIASTANFGGATLTSAGGTDLFVAKYDPAGNYLWAQSFGDPSLQSAAAAAFDPMGNVLVTGFTTGPVDFGGGPVAGFGEEDVIVVKLGP